MQKERAVHWAESTLLSPFLVSFMCSLVFCSVLASPNSKPFPSVYHATGYWYNISLSFKQFIIFHFPAFRFNVPCWVRYTSDSTFHSLFYFYFDPLHTGDMMLLSFLTQRLIRIASIRSFVFSLCSLYSAIFLIYKIQIEESRMFVLVGLYFTLESFQYHKELGSLVALNGFQTSYPINKILGTPIGFK